MTDLFHGTSGPRDAGIAIVGESRRIPLSKALVAIVSVEDYVALAQYDWYADERSNGIVYAKTDQLPGRPRMHTVVLERMHGEIAPPSTVSNHKNYNGLDNRRENLERISPSENVRHGRHKTGKSGHRCIHWHKQRQKWCVQFTINYKKVFGGLHASLNDAIEARDNLFKAHGL